VSPRRLYWSALAGQWRGGVVLLGCSLLEGVPAFFSGRLVELSVDRGFSVGAPDAGLGWLALFGLAAVLGAFGARMVWHQLGKVVEPLRDALVTAVVRGVLHDDSPPRNQPDSSGVARITQHVEVVRDATAGLLVQARGMLVTTASALAGLVTVAGALVVPVAVPVIASLVAFVCLLPSLARRQRALALADEHTAATAGASLAGMRDIVACGAEPIAALAMYDAVDKQANAAIRVARSSAIRALVISLGGFIPLLLALALAPGLVARGELTAGAALGALVYLATTMQPALRGLAATAGTVVLRLLVALRRLAETAELPDVSDGTATPRGTDVQVHGLTFGWGATAEPVVRGLDLSLRPGEHLAVVGPSGIGKSTLAGLLTGMLVPQEGRVLLGGVPVRDVPAALRHELVALIPQEAYVFAGTVRDNVSLFAPHPSDRALVEAALAVAESRSEGYTAPASGLALALDYFRDRPMTASRVVLLVSDGGATIKEESREKLKALFAERHASLIWIYTRGEGEPSILDPPKNREIDSLTLHEFFGSMGSPYEMFEVTSADGLEHAVAEVGRLTNLPTRYEQRLPRRDLATPLFALALAGIGFLGFARAMEVEAWQA